MSEDYDYRVVYRGRNGAEPQFWTVWVTDLPSFSRARIAENTLAELKGNCEVKIQRKPLPSAWADVNDASQNI